MTIWRYDAKSSDPIFTHLAVATELCLFCGDPLVRVKIVENNSAVNLIRSVVWSCKICGWWRLSCVHDDLQLWPTKRNHYGAAAILRQFDLTGMAEPVSEVRRYLTAKYGARFDLDPHRMEEIVASVYRDIGFRTVVTARSGDDGIDIILTGPDDRQVGVQVKRSRNAIKVEAIRALTGALVVNNLTAGVFVTTSWFQRGAKRTVDLAAVRGVAIELVDAEKFYDALKLVNREESADADAISQLSVVDMIFLETERYRLVTEWLGEIGVRDTQVDPSYEDSGDPAS